MRPHDRGVESVSPCGIWQLAHCVSSSLDPARVVRAGGEVHVVVAGPHAAREGLVRNALACAAPVVCDGTLRNAADRRIGRIDHRRIIVGPEAELSLAYFLPATTLGREEPMWILWMKNLKSSVSPVFGSMFCGVMAHHAEVERRAAIRHAPITDRDMACSSKSRSRRAYASPWRRWARNYKSCWRNWWSDYTPSDSAIRKCRWYAWPLRRIRSGAWS